MSALSAAPPPDSAFVQVELKHIIASSLSKSKKCRALVELLADVDALDIQGEEGAY